MVYTFERNKISFERNKISFERNRFRSNEIYFVRTKSISFERNLFRSNEMLFRSNEIYFVRTKSISFERNIKSVARDLIWPRHISAFMPRQQPKFTKLKYFVTLTCSHGGVKVKMKCTLHIYIVPSVDWYHHWRNRSSSFGGEANTNCYPVRKNNSQNRSIS